jgi:cyclic-di-GMP phosphodiesterase, flagellum assembly factor TipF
MEAIIMPVLFWLALLLGYLTGVVAAVLMLPARLIEPLYGPLALTSVLALAACGVLLRLRQMRRRAAPRGAASPHQPPAGRRRLPLDRDAQAEPAADGPADAREAQDGRRRPLMVRLEPPGAIGPAELREILYQGRVDVRLRPLATLAQPGAALYHALPRLRNGADEHLEPARYRTTAARAGLLGMIDRLLLLRCIDMLRATRAAGREPVVVCGITAASLDDPAFTAELDQQLSDDATLAKALVLALDHVVHDRPSVDAVARLRARGLRFCLRRLGPPPLDGAALRTAGFAYILLEADRFGQSAADPASDPALVELQRLLGADGPQLLVRRTDPAADSVTIVGEWAFSATDATFDVARPSAA